MNKPSSQNQEIKKMLDAQSKDIKHHMSALGEEYQSRLQGVTEMVGKLMEDSTIIKTRLDGHDKKFNSLDEKIGKLGEDVTIVKDNVEFLKSGLKKKVDYDEFMALEKRISIVEAKVRSKV